MDFRLEKASLSRLSRLVLLEETGWLLLVALVPLVINVWGVRPFELPKVIVLQTLVWLLAGLIAAEVVFGQTSLFPQGLSQPIWQAAGLLTLVIGVTTMNAVDRNLSLWGSFYRIQGAVVWLTYLLLFVLASVRFREPARVRRVITAMSATAIPILLLSLAQAAGWHPLGLSSDARSPMFATLGRSNFVGGYLVILLPLTLYLFLTTAQSGLRWLWALTLIGELGVIGLTRARGAWLATLASLAVFALLWWGERLRTRWRILAWSGVGLLFLSGPLAVLWWGQRSLGSIAARLAIWKATLRLIAQRPFTGYGADSLGMVFSQVYPPELVHLQGRGYFVDHAHNILLDWLVTMGIPGLLAMTFLLVSFIILIARTLSQSGHTEKRGLLIALLTAVLGNFAQNLISFDVTATAMASWLLMGMGVALSVSPSIQSEESVEKHSWRQWTLIALVFLGVGLAVWQINGRQLAADIAARTAQRRTLKDDWIGAIAADERAVHLWPAEPAYYLQLSQAYWGQALATQKDANMWLNNAELALITAQQRRPGEVAIWLQSAYFYDALSRQFGARMRTKMNYAYRQASALSPTRAIIYRDWGRGYLAEGNPEAAAPLLRKAIELDGNDAESYMSLGEADLALNRFESARSDFQEAAWREPHSSAAFSGLAQALWLLGRKEEAVKALQTALQIDPKNIQALNLSQTINLP